MCASLTEYCRIQSKEQKSISYCSGVWEVQGRGAVRFGGVRTATCSGGEECWALTEEEWKSEGMLQGASYPRDLITS